MPQIVVAFCGLPGSGKSMLAHALQVHTRWPRLDRDALRREMFSAGGYSDEDKQQLNRVIRARVQAALVAGESVIVDGMTFARQSERNAFSELASSYQADWLLAWLDCDVNIAKERIDRDALHPALDRNPALVEKVAARFETPMHALRIDAALAVSEQLQLLLTEIDRGIRK